MRTRLFLLAACGLMVAVGSRTLAGPLNPPAGPVAPTAKPLSDVEARIAINATNTPGDPLSDASPSTFKISQPGSYYLTANVAGEAGKAGIEITADGVTVDLNGFIVAGAGTNGISAVGTSLNNIVIRNGTVQLSGIDGINLPDCSNARVEHVTVVSNVGFGIEVGSRATVLNCIARANANTGIIAGNESIISDCVSSLNTNAGGVNPRGIQAGARAVISRCVVNNNEGNGLLAGIGSRLTDCTVASNGFAGISTAQSCIISGCISQSNASGFVLDFGTTISACTARDNTGTGFSINAFNVVTDCTALGNNVGFDVFTNARLTRCVAQGSASHGFSINSSSLTECSAMSNSGHGFNVLATAPGTSFTGCAATGNVLSGFNILSARARLTDCQAERNTQNGVLINVANGLDEAHVQSCIISENGVSGLTTNSSTSVIDCNVSNNGGVGISVQSSCTVRGCTLTSNVGSGIRATSSNIIQNNTLSSNALGVAGAGSAGILCTSDDNRVEGNFLVSNTQDGIRLNAAGNLVIRNTLSRNGTTINAAANNRIAQIITITTTGFVSTDPNANIIY